MGFWCFETLNKALQIKQLWRICTSPNLLVSRVIKAKYIRNNSILQVESKPPNSFAWKSMGSVASIFQTRVQMNEADPSALTWRSSTTGDYTVKEGYQYAYSWKQTHENYQGESSNGVLIQRC